MKYNLYTFFNIVYITVKDKRKIMENVRSTAMTRMLQYFGRKMFFSLINHVKRKLMGNMSAYFRTP